MRGFQAPDDFVDGVAFADGIHHLADEQFEPATFVAIQSIGASQVRIEIFEGGFVAEGLGLRFAGEVWKNNHFPTVPRDGLLAFRRHGLDGVIALLDGFPGEGRFGQITLFEGIQDPHQFLRRQIPNWRLSICERIDLSIGDDAGHRIVLGVIKDCEGSVLGDPGNKVLYADAFTGIRADVLYP
jgi:hypothetical protein